MSLKVHITAHMIKNEDLNHHGTLFAGKTAMWFVEAGFIAAADLAGPKNIVLKSVHEINFTKPVYMGSVIRFESKVIIAKNARLVTYVKVVDNFNEDFILDGYISFIHIDKTGRSLPHNIDIGSLEPEDTALQEKAKKLYK
ncbi:MAG: hotdog domain-containing protein [Smithella sp.]